MLMDERRRFKQKIEMQVKTISQVRMELYRLCARLAPLREQNETLRQENEQLREHLERAVTTISGMDFVLSALAAENDELRRLAGAPPKEGRAMAN